MTDDTLSVRGLAATYGQAIALRGISFSVAEGSLTALLGENGAGKTTLLRSIARLHTSTTGSIFFCGEEISRVDPANVAARGLTLVREGAKVFETLSVTEHIALSQRLAGLRPAGGTREDQSLDRVWEWFPVLYERRAEKAGYLSGGQRQMLALSMALISRPKLVLLDEPSAGLAESVAEHVYSVVERLSQEGMTLVIAEQSSKWVGGKQGTAYLLESGQIVGTQPLDGIRA